MATTGYTSVAVTSYDTLRFTWTASSQNIANNNTTVSWKLELIAAASGAINSSTSKSWSVNINGSTYSGTNTVGISANTTKLLASGTTTIAHNADGTKSFDYSFSQGFGITFSGSAIGTISGSGSGTLNTIPRASSLSYATTHIESTGTITINRASSSFTHTITYVFGYLSGTIATKTTAASVSWLVPKEFYAQIPNGTTGYGTFTCTTYSGNIVVGTTTLDFKATTNKALCQPTVAPTVSDVNPATIILTGNDNILIKYYSDLKYNIGAKAHNSATLKNQRIICGTKDSTDMTGTLLGIDSGTIVVRAHDSRGYTTEQTITKTIIDYFKPTCNISATAPTTGGALKFTVSGNWFNGTFGAINNGISVQYRILENDTVYSNWTQAEYTTNGNTYNADIEVTGLNYLNTYTIQARVGDQLEPNVDAKERKVKTVPIFDWGENDFNFNVPVSINKQPINDFIVEQGQESDWYFRKWNSGIMECWRIYTATGVNAAENNYSGFYYSGTLYVDFPFKFINYPVVQLDGGSSNYMNFIRKFGSYTDKATFTVVGLTPVAEATINVDIYAIGRYK